MYKVFLADDEIWVTVGLRKLIERSGLPFGVIGEANDGVTAWEEIQKKAPDVLFVDIRMPGMDGLELLQKICDTKKNINVVIVSGYAEFEYAREAVRMRAVDYLLKPVEQETMNQVLQKIYVSLTENHDITEESSGVERAREVPKSVLDTIIREIQEFYTEDISLTEFSSRYGISRGHLSSLLKERLGLPFSEYLSAKRIQKAKELLADEKLSLNAIADAVGYHDYFYFIKVFKKITGISPSAYRKTL